MKQVTLLPTEARKATLQIESDARWSALMTASSAEIDAYLNANITSLGQVRVLLRSLLVAVRYLMHKQPT